MIKPFFSKSADERILEDELYVRVFEEIEQGQMDKAAQARAIEEGGSDAGAVKKAYIKHRMTRLKAEHEVVLRQKAERDAKLRERQIADAVKKAEEERLSALKREKYEQDKAAGLSDEQIQLYGKIEKLRNTKNRDSGASAGAFVLIIMLILFGVFWRLISLN